MELAGMHDLSIDHSLGQQYLTNLVLTEEKEVKIRGYMHVDFGLKFVGWVCVFQRLVLPAVCCEPHLHSN